MLIDFFTEFFCFLPEIFFGVNLCSLLLFCSFFSDAFFSQIKKTFLLFGTAFWLCTQIIVFTLLLFLNNSSYFLIAFFGALVYDFSAFSVKVFLFVFVFLVFVTPYFQYKKDRFFSFEYYLLVLFSCFAMIVLLQANDFLTFYLAIELQSLSFYCLASFKKNSSYSVEAGLKYFLMGAFSSGFLLFGCSLVYNACGTTNYSVLKALFFIEFSENFLFSSITLGLLFVLVSFSFKLASAPWHFWVADVYEGSPTTVSFFFGVLPKTAVFFSILRVVFSCFYVWFFIWVYFFMFCGFFSLFFGAAGAFTQRKIKRFLAFSSVVHVGFLFLAVATATLLGLFSAFFYLFLYTVISFGFWSLMFSFSSSAFSGYSSRGTVRYLQDFGFVFKENTALFITLVILVFSMAGIPPLAGFYSKMFVFFSLFCDSDLHFSSFVVVCLSMFSVFYYLRFVKIVSFENFTYSSHFDSVLFYYTDFWFFSAFVTSFFIAIISGFFFDPGLLFFLSHRISLLFFI